MPRDLHARADRYAGGALARGHKRALRHQRTLLLARPTLPSHAVAPPAAQSPGLSTVISNHVAEHTLNYDRLVAALAAEAASAAPGAPPPPNVTRESYFHHAGIVVRAPAQTHTHASTLAHPCALLTQQPPCPHFVPIISSFLQTTRAFSFYIDPSALGRGQMTWLLPGLDLLNTEAYCNCRRAFTGVAEAPGSVVEIRAEKRIAAGEELTWPYHSDVARADITLLLYGMVNGTDTRLAGIDLPRRARAVAAA